MIQKTECRQILLQRRKAIPPKRREQAAQLLVDALKFEGNILSFLSMGSEIDLGPLNQKLEREHRLFIVPYSTEMQVPLEKISCILVPGLGFDRKKDRIGYGKGFYDRFLLKAKHILTVGVGFQEQLLETNLPRDPWDISLDQLLLV